MLFKSDLSRCQCTTDIWQLSYIGLVTIGVSTISFFFDVFVEIAVLDKVPSACATEKSDTSFVERRGTLCLWKAVPWDNFRKTLSVWYIAQKIWLDIFTWCSLSSLPSCLYLCHWWLLLSSYQSRLYCKTVDSWHPLRWKQYLCQMKLLSDHNLLDFSWQNTAVATVLCILCASSHPFLLLFFSRANNVGMWVGG